MAPQGISLYEHRSGESIAAQGCGNAERVMCAYVAVCVEQLAGTEVSDIARRIASCSKVFPRSFSPEKKLVTR